ncbi:MAG: hypothetical protein C0469_07890 [Cyanobacteria bacterium DS2.3.42]|nr:hypothetical protein [Cyanobacteria bacterium DS2.3.42]
MFEMLTRAEATQQGMKFAEQWDKEKHTVGEDGMKAFAQELHSLNSLPAAQKNSLKWAELRGATDGLITRNVLPNLDVADNKTNLRNCRVVGLTADGDKNSGNDDLVVAIGRRTDNTSRAENVVILGQDGKFYQARQVQGGYVRSEEVIAENAAELERKYNRAGFTPKSKDEVSKEKERTEEKKTTEEITERKGNPADLEAFRDELKSFQKQSPSIEALAQTQLDRLAKEYSQLSGDQQKIVLSDVMENNRAVLEDVWVCGLRASRPQVAIQRGEDGTIRFSADWADGTTFFRRPRSHQVFSQKFKLESSTKTR